MLESIRKLVADLHAILDRVDGMLAADNTGELPVLTLARTVIVADRAAGQLGTLADKLAAAAAKAPPACPKMLRTAGADK
jgi:hypothetical protein